MKRLLPLIAFLTFCTGQATAQDTTVTFDFTDSEQITTVFHIDIPENNSGTSVNDRILSINEASISFAKNNAATDCRIFATKNTGALNLRTYKTSATTFSVSEGYIINKIEIVSGNADNMASESNTWSSGSYSGGFWTPTEGVNVNSVTQTAGTTLQYNKVTIYYSEGEPTSISNIVIDRPSDDHFYNLMGQRITTPRGIVIKNGKKYIYK